MVDQRVHLWVQPTVGQMAALRAHLKVAQMVKHWVHWMIDHLVLLKGCTSVEMTAGAMVGLMVHQMGCQMVYTMVVYWVAMMADWTAFQMVECSAGQMVQQMDR